MNTKWFLYFFLIAFVCVLSIFPIRDQDTWWHLKTGQYIIETNSVPEKDPFSYTMGEKYWITHEWLSQVLFYMVYDAGGITGLTIFKALITGFIFLLMLGAIKPERVAGKTPAQGIGFWQYLITWILFAFAFLVLREGIRERPQIFTYLFCALYLMILRRRRLLDMYLIPIIHILWANMHGTTTIIGYGLVGIYVLFGKEIPKKLRLYLLIATFIATFINPNTYRLFEYFFTFFTQGFNKLSMEYMPPKLILWFLPYFLFLAIALGSLFLPGKREVTDIFVILISAVASLMANRNIPIFVIFAAPIAAERYTRLLMRNKKRGQAKYGDRQLALASSLSPFFTFPILPVHFVSYWKLVLTSVCGAALFSFFWFAGKKLDFHGIYRPGIGDRHICRHAVEVLHWMNKAGLKDPMFNHYDLGGYLIWKLYPQYKVFVDGRLVEYGADFIKDAANYWQPDVWNKLEAKYKFSFAVIKQEDKYRALYLDDRKDWILVYWDDTTLIYLKDIPQNRRFIERMGYKFLRPNAQYHNYLSSFPKHMVLEELNRAIYFAPQSVGARKIKRAVEDNM